MSYEGNFDVVIEGVGAERGARVLAAPEGLYVNKHQVPYSTLLGVALRGSILLVVGTQVAMALRGSHEGLATLAAELRTRADLEHLAQADRDALQGERVVFATPVALSGLVEMERFKGMALEVVTDQALHVFERGGRHFRLSWDRITKVDVTQAKFGRLLRIGSGPTQLEILYLTDAQIQTIRGLASRHSSALLGVAGDAQPAQPAAADAPAVPEARAEENLTRRFTIPEFEASLGAVGAGSDRPLGAAIDRLQMSSLLPVGFLEEHLRELRNIYDGALLKAKREAAASGELLAAAEALSGRRLWDAVLDNIGVAADATVRAFERQTRRIAANRRIPWRKARSKFMPSAKEISGVRQRLTRGVAALEGPLKTVSQAAEGLRPAAQAGPAELKEAYNRWQASLKELDQAYATGWTGLSREVVGVWQDAFLPRLTRLGGERRRMFPRPLKYAFYFLLLLAIAGFVYLYFTGQLSQVIQFEPAQ
ncbi:MAG: hypothetical protein PVJ64_16540 [Gemmatimonadales bacterium]|jgi:hypothetical protein